MPFFLKLLLICSLRGLISQSLHAIEEETRPEEKNHYSSQQQPKYSRSPQNRHEASAIRHRQQNLHLYSTQRRQAPFPVQALELPPLTFDIELLSIKNTKKPESSIAIIPKPLPDLPLSDDGIIPVSDENKETYIEEFSALPPLFSLEKSENNPTPILTLPPSPKQSHKEEEKKRFTLKFLTNNAISRAKTLLPRESSKFNLSDLTPITDVMKEFEIKKGGIP